MKICWDNLEGVYLLNKGKFRKGSDTYVYKERCKWCGEPYLAMKYRQSDYCSIKCTQIKDITNQMFGKLEVKEFKGVDKRGVIWECKCECGNIIDVHATDLQSGNTKSCSCLKYRAGGDNPNWNPNLTPEDRINRRKIPGYSTWVQEVFKLDNHTCQCCGDAKGHDLNAHHIESYNNNPGLRTEISNGITLCETCHKEFHHQYGYGNNTRAQLIEFFKGEL